MSGDIPLFRQLGDQAQESGGIVYVIPVGEQVDSQPFLESQRQRIGRDARCAHLDFSRQTGNWLSRSEQVVSTIAARPNDHLRPSSQGIEAGHEVISRKGGTVAVHDRYVTVPLAEVVRQGVIESFSETIPSLRNEFEVGRQRGEILGLISRQISQNHVYVLESSHEVHCIIQQALIQVGRLDGGQGRY